MKRIILLLSIIAIFLQFLAAGQYSSVPIGHRAYAVIDSAELRGLLAPSASVRPYTASFILKQFRLLLESGNISEIEKNEINRIIEQLSPDFTTPENFSDLVNYGAYQSTWDEVGISAAFGVNGDIELTHSITERGIYDSRNVGRAYLEADILDFASIYMDFGVRMDHLEPSLFLQNDFTIPSEGTYDTLFGASTQNTFYYGLDLHPEISLSFLQGNIQLRWASIKRDWGVGTNNLMLSGSARSFEGIELSINFTPWLRYNFITGSLGKFASDNIDDDSESLTYYFDNYHFSDKYQKTLFNNNYSAHRVELSLPFNLSFGIYESVVYGKRFELAYLNPFNIIMFQQNILGDFDNMLAGIDFQWRLPGILRAYGAIATTEMSKISPASFFKNPRNIMGLQGGVDFHIPVANFTQLTFQYTYLNAFFYTHYPRVDISASGDSDNPYNRERTSELMYVNEGANIGYPLRPNSDEILVKLSMGITEDISGDITAKYQRRSGQYGFNMDEFMVYSAFNDDLYPEKDFAGNLFEKTFGLDLGISKTFKNAPVTVYAKYLYSVTNYREPEPVTVWDYTKSYKGEEGDVTDQAYDPDSPNYHVILYSVDDSLWSGWQHSHAVQIGVSLWH